MSHCLVDLRACQPLAARPKFIPKARLRGRRAAGLTFERKVGKVLSVLFSHVHSGVWFEYHDSKRSGVCQIDHYVLRPGMVLLVECKLSESDDAWEQMSRLYAPILERHYGLPVSRVQATRCLRSSRALLDDPRQAKSGREHLWQVLV